MGVSCQVPLPKRDELTSSERLPRLPILEHVAVTARVTASALLDRAINFEAAMPK